MLIYKYNLSASNGRYGDLERRVIQLFTRNPDRDDIWLLDGLEILLMYLLEDGIIEPTGLVEGIKETPLAKKQYRLGARGRDYIRRWFPPEKGDS